MSNIIFSVKNRLKHEHWEKFANNKTLKNPAYFNKPIAKVKHICIKCLKNETSDARSKTCATCFDDCPKVVCDTCKKEFNQIKKYHKVCIDCYVLKKRSNSTKA